MIESKNIIKAVHWIGKFRVRLIVILLIPLIFAVGVYAYSDYILGILTSPLKENTLFFMTPIEGVLTKLKVALFGGLLVSLPINVYLIASMFSSMLKVKTRRKLYFLVLPFGTISLYAGIVFAYTLILPTTIEFLLNSGSDFMKPMISGSNYISFIAFFLLAIGLVFELPLVLIALSRIGIVKYRMLVAKRRTAILISFIILAVVTPTPDAFTLLASALPVLILYEVSIWSIFILERLDKRSVKEKR